MTNSVGLNRGRIADVAADGPDEAILTSQRQLACAWNVETVLGMPLDVNDQAAVTAPDRLLQQPFNDRTLSCAGCAEYGYVLRLYIARHPHAWSEVDAATGGHQPITPCLLDMRNTEPTVARFAADAGLDIAGPWQSPVNRLVDNLIALSTCNHRGRQQDRSLGQHAVRRQRGDRACHDVEYEFGDRADRADCPGVCPYVVPHRAKKADIDANGTIQAFAPPDGRSEGVQERP